MNSTPLPEAHILVIDDDDRLRSLLRRFLQEQGFAVNAAATCAQARELMRFFQFDLLVLDVMIPGESGLEFAHSLSTPRPPILMLSARAEAHDRISGLEAGVDDYLTKPFEPKELLLRIRAILKRSIPQETSVSFGTSSVDVTTGQLTTLGKPVMLTTAEMALLKALAAAPKTAISRGRLAELAQLGNERSVDVQITRLRKKMDLSGDAVYIHTIRGEGYGLFP